MSETKGRVIELADQFSLWDEFLPMIQQEVRERAGKKQKFSFSGSNGTDMCQQEGAHVPHVRDVYTTVCHGELYIFCLGREGPTPEGFLHIIVQKKEHGSPEFPGFARGFWFLAE